MEKKELIKILVVLISIIFIVQMFTWFEREQRIIEEEQKIKSVSGITIGKIKGYSRELYIEPWKADYSSAELIKEMKDAGEIDYINIMGAKGVLILSQKVDIVKIREKISNEFNASFYAEAILIPNPTNLTFENGTVREFPLPPLTLKVDPINPIGEELTIEITGDFDEVTNNFIKVGAVLLPSTNLFTAVGELGCSGNDLYRLNGAVPWSKRDIDIAQYTQKLNIAESDIKYSRTDSVLFSKPLNINELKNLRDKNLSYILSSLPDNITVNTTESELVTKDLAFLDRILEFPPSSLSVTLAGRNVIGSVDENSKNENMSFNEEMEKVASILNATFNDTVENIEIYKKCNIIINEARKMEAVVKNGNNTYYIHEQKKNSSFYVKIDEVRKNSEYNKVNVFFVGKHIGRKIIDIEELNIE